MDTVGVRIGRQGVGKKVWDCNARAIRVEGPLAELGVGFGVVARFEDPGVGEHVEGAVGGRGRRNVASAVVYRFGLWY